MGFLEAWDNSLLVLQQRSNSKESSQTVFKKSNKLKKEPAIILSCIIEDLVQVCSSVEGVKEILQNCPLQQDRCELIIQQYDMIAEMVSSIRSLNNPREELVDLQWKFGVVAGSSTLDEAGKTFVQVKLVSNSINGGMFARHIEMTMDKFYALLHQLEKAKASMDYLKLI